MYSNNNEISDRQIFRQIIVSTLPLGLLFFPAVTWKLGAVISTLGGVLLWGVTLLSVVVGHKVLKKCKKNREGRGKNRDVENRGRKGCKGIKIAVFLLKLRYLGLAALCVMVLIKSSKDLLLNEMNAIVILVFTGLVIYYFQCHSDEVFARFVETVFILVIAPVIISVVLGVFNIDFAEITSKIGSEETLVLSLGEIVQNNSDRITPARIKLGEYVLMIIISIFAFVPCSALLINETKRSKLISSPATIVKAFSVTWGIIILTNIVLWLQPSYRFMEFSKYPFLTMLKTVGIPGKFMERQEAVFGMFVIMALIIQTGAYLKNCTDNYKKITGAVWIGVAMIAGILIFAGVTKDFEDITLKKSLYAGKDVENREYVLMMGIDKAEDMVQVTFTMENSDVKSKTYRAETLEDAIEVYRRQCEKMVDLTHTKLIMLGEKAVRDEKLLGEIKEYIKEDNMGLNLLVCKTSEEINEMVEKTDKVSKNFGIYVSDLLVKSGYDKVNAAFIFGYEDEEMEDIIEEKTANISVKSGIPVIKD